VSPQLLVDNALEECGSVIEGKHVAGADMIPRANLNQNQIDETQGMGGICDRLRKWNAQPIGADVFDGHWTLRPIAGNLPDTFYVGIHIVAGASLQETRVRVNTRDIRHR